MDEEATFYIVEITTREGKVCERLETYEEARRRVELFPAEGLVGLPLIFQQLPDGSQRLVREDGKPLQWHRLPEDRPAGPDDPIPLSDVDPASLGITGPPTPLTPPASEEWVEEDVL